MFNEATLQEILLPSPRWWEKYVSKCSLINILIHNVLNLLYYEQWTDKRNFFRYTSMARLVVNSVEMWDKCSVPRVMPSFRENIYYKNGTSFLHHIWKKTFKCLYKKYLGGVSGTCVIYRPQLLICRPGRKQLNWRILSRKFKFLSCTSWGNHAIKQIYIFWRIFKVVAGIMYNLQI